MWSATWPIGVRRLAEEFLGEYVDCTIGSLSLAANGNITQLVAVLREYEKPAKLEELLRLISQESERKVSM